MDITVALSLVGPWTLFSTLVVGFIVGAVFLYNTPTARHSAVLQAFAVSIVGIAFLVFIGLARALESLPRWEVTLGTGMLWILFACAIGVGISVRKALAIPKEMRVRDDLRKYEAHKTNMRSYDRTKE